MSRRLHALLALAWGAGLTFSPAAAAPLPQAAKAACLQLMVNPPDISLDRPAFERGVKIWVETCRQALATEGSEPNIMLALARALAADGQRAEAVDLWRAAAAHEGNAEASYQLYETHRAFDRGDVNRAQLVTRAEAEAALRRAAEIGHRDAMHMLAVRLDRGGVVKRDADGARLWAERSLAAPPAGASPADIALLLGRLLTRSERPEERARGLGMLEGLARAGRGDAKAVLAAALRPSDPVRARDLLEQALESHPGHAIPALADMLIKGEGGSQDIPRALALLRGRSAADAPAVRAAYGQLLLEGRLVPRDTAEAVRLIAIQAQWDQEARLQVMGLLAAHPEIHLRGPNSFLYDATEATELGEPGALAALIALKLSTNSQFADRAGGCALADRAARAGDAGAGRPTVCRAD
ncbi:MAG: hypothetical protein J0H01_16255 [Rhizobiales bacterium]|nr:hypothetical protein [Hyphomicrobiales bacterium]